MDQIKKKTCMWLYIYELLRCAHAQVISLRRTEGMVFSARKRILQYQQKPLFKGELFDRLVQLSDRSGVMKSKRVMASTKSNH